MHSVAAKISALLLMMASISPAHAEVPAPERLSPSTPWNIDYAENSCRLRRAFGSDDKLVLLQIARSWSQDRFQLTLAGKQFRGWRPPEKLTIQYGDGGRLDELRYYTAGTAGDGTPMILATSSLAVGRPDEIVTPEQEAAVTQIVLSHRNRGIVLRTGSLGAAFAQMGRCTDQLLMSLGIDPEKLRNAQRRATPAESPGNWATSDDYTGFSGAKGMQAIVNFRLIVGMDGSVSNCLVIDSQISHNFDDLTCKLLLKRAKFQPALDADGVPMPDVYFNRVRWGPYGG